MAPLYKFKLSDTPPSERDIHASQNFDAILNKHQVAVKRRRLSKKLLVVASIILILSIGFFSFPIIIQNDERISPINLSRLEPLIPKMQEILPLPENNITKVPEVVLQDFTSEKKTDSSKKNYRQNLPAEDTANTEARFTEAVPRQGYDGLYNYIATELVYPVTARSDSIEGTVQIEFKINKSGEVQDAKVLQSVREDVDQEALRLINDMPAWYPAMINDIPITTRQIIPITFRIEDKEE